MAASFAALIRDKLGIPVELVKGRSGQFEVMVDDRSVASRKGGLLARLVNRPWPAEEEVLGAVREALQDETAPPRPPI